MQQQPLFDASSYASVDVGRLDDLEYWCRTLRATPNQIRQGVKAVGTDVRELQQYILKARMSQRPE